MSKSSLTSQTEEQASPPISKQRLRSLDVFRGLTVALMILVNNPGNWAAMYPPLQHASWHGCTPTDLVFPFFLFAVGNSLAIVMTGLVKKGRTFFWFKISKRVILIFGIGLLLNLSPFVRWDANEQLVPKGLDTLRILGVLQRIAIAFGGAAALIWLFNSSKRPNLTLAIAAVLLLGYWGACLLLAHGLDPYSIEGFFGTHFDRFFIGSKHLYTGEGVPFDPEGLVSTVPSIAQVLLGWWVGRQIVQNRINTKLTTRLLIWGFCLSVLAYIWQLGFPLNKKIWSSSFVLLTTGFATILLSTLIYWIEKTSSDIEIEDVSETNWKLQSGLVGFALGKLGRWICMLLEAFGKNPLFIFVLSGLIPRCLGLIRWQSGVDPSGKMSWSSPLSWVYKNFFANLSTDPRLGSFVYSIALLCIYAGIVLWMDRQKIYVRV